MARYAFQITGEQEEYGLTENVFRFEASISALDDEPDLSMIHGLLVDHEGAGDLCIKVLKGSDRAAWREVEIIHGPRASDALLGCAGTTTHVTGHNVLFLHHPTVIDIDSGRQPGTRLLSSVRRHFSGRSLEVVVDLGTSEEDTSFTDYFFPGLDVLGLRARSARLLHGRWGPCPPSMVDPYEIGVDYGCT